MLYAIGANGLLDEHLHATGADACFKPEEVEANLSDSAANTKLIARPFLYKFIRLYTAKVLIE
jgi:hypothetical protein